MLEQPEATRESPDDAKDDKELVRLWLDAIAIADKEEKNWRECADDTVKLYRQHDERRSDGESISDKGGKFNILHANVETMLPALYNSTPIPDVRRRYGDPDAIAKEVCDLQERCLSYSVDVYDFDELMRMSAKDMELTGRGVDRVRYLPYLSGEGDAQELAYEEVRCEHVQWKNFRRGPAHVWDDVPWVAFKLFLTRDELVKLSPKHGKAVNLDACIEGADDRKDGNNVPEVFKRAIVWEIWDKNTREVLFIAESFKERPIRVEKDPLSLMEFFPVPRPLYAVTTSDSLIPIVPYEIYKDQAKELERVSQRIMALTEALKARGVYDGRASEISRLADADDCEMLAIEQVALFTDGVDLSKKIAYWPIEVIAVVLEKLYLARDQIKQTIYEITGIADILRGNTDPNETLGAQELKAQWGSLRIQNKQAEIARYARDLFELKAEIICRKFDWNTITLMSGLKYPTQEEKQRAQAMAQQAQAAQQPLPPELEQILSKPSAEEVEQLLRDDATRGFRIDIESDSTIRADLTRMQQNMNLFLQGTAQYGAAMGPIVMAPQFQSLAPAVLEIFSAFARTFKLGKQAEDALDSVADRARKQAEQPQEPQEDPAVQVEKLKAQNEAKKMEMEAQFQREKHEMELQMMQAKLEMEREKLAMQQQKMQLDMQAHQQKMAMDAEAQQRDAVMQERQAGMEMQRAEHEHSLGMESTEHKHRTGMEALDAKTAAAKQQAKLKAKPKVKAA
jgi:hypothetical protein